MTSEEQIKSTIEDFFHSMNTQNLDLMKQLIPNKEATIHIGTDDDEIWKGWGVLNEATEEQFKGLEYYHATIRDLTINVASSGDVAWYFHLLDAEIKSRGKITSLEGARFTGVLEKENDRWLITQTHVSLPASI